MSYPLIYRGCYLVQTMADTLRYHIGNPSTPGYASREEAYDAIDALIDNQGEEHDANALAARQ